MSQPCATMCIQVPTLEITTAAHKMRKSRCRRAPSDTLGASAATAGAEVSASDIFVFSSYCSARLLQDFPRLPHDVNADCSSDHQVRIEGTRQKMRTPEAITPRFATTTARVKIRVARRCTSPDRNRPSI